MGVKGLRNYNPSIKYTAVLSANLCHIIQNHRMLQYLPSVYFHQKETKPVRKISSRLSLFIFDILGERKTSLFKSVESSNWDIDQMGVLESTKIQQNNLCNMNKKWWAMK